MNFSFHNQLIIKTKTNNYTFYNSILKSTLDKLSNFEKYNEYLSIGNGTANQESQNNFHLSNKLLTTKLVNSSYQNDLFCIAKIQFIFIYATFVRKVINKVTNNGKRFLVRFPLCFCCCYCTVSYNVSISYSLCFSEKSSQNLSFLLSLNISQYL